MHECLAFKSSLTATPWTVARQASLSMGFSRQEYWSGLPFLFPEDLPNPGIEPEAPVPSPLLQEYSFFFFFLGVFFTNEGSPK